VNGWGGHYRPPTWRQPVGWGALHETPPIITAPVVRESPGDWLYNGLLRPAWAHRLELALFGLVSIAYVWLGDRLGREGAERLIVAAAFLVATITWTREPLAHALFRSHLRRRWALACRHAKLATRNDRIPGDRGAEGQDVRGMDLLGGGKSDPGGCHVPGAGYLPNQLAKEAVLVDQISDLLHRRFHLRDPQVAKLPSKGFIVRSGLHAGGQLSEGSSESSQRTLQLLRISRTSSMWASGKLGSISKNPAAAPAWRA
jgi:hypothetical protein